MSVAYYESCVQEIKEDEKLTYFEKKILLALLEIEKELMNIQDRLP